MESLDVPADLGAADAIKPLLFVVIDTEEEFDWSAPFSRANTRVTAMRHLARGQEIFDRFSIKPTYVVDYPVASQADGYLPLREIAADDRCAIGAHLHPWVNPPDAEDVTRRNSFVCNLPPPVQEAKLRRLSEVIGTNLEIVPRVFKAGRYGLGDTTVKLLDEMQFAVDTSVSPSMDFSAEGGPDFRGRDSQPFFLTPNLLEVPCTIGYVGWAGRWRAGLHRLADRPALARLRVPGILARGGAVNKVMLSPEGNTFEEMKELTEVLFQSGQRTFTFSFHSPSLDVGHTPYVRSRGDLDEFLSRIERYCEFFVTRLQGRPAGLESFRGSLVHQRRGAE
jgi:hypothetical protein